MSNNPLSTTGSNGRTLLGLVGGVVARNLAQFYITAASPDVRAAGRYFRLTDRDAVVLATTGRQTGEEAHPVDACRGTSGLSAAPLPRARRTPLTMLLRECVWELAAFRGLKRLAEFVDEFAPEVVFVQAGDSSFILRMARNISKERGIPLVVFNSEDYYFKEHNYLEGSRLQRPVYKLWHWHFRRTLAQTVDSAEHVIYSCDPLARKFQTTLPKTVSSTVLTPSSIEPRSLGHRVYPERFVYAGNLGLGRFRSLVELAEALAFVAPSSKLVVYGPPLKPDDVALAGTVSNLDYRGFLPYSEVVRELRESDVSVHVESFEPDIRRDTLHAFSTKIADCLASGTPLLLYAPPEIASTQYVRGHGIGIVATSVEELPAAVRRMLALPLREELSSRAVQVAARNHDPRTNEGRILQILGSAVANHCEALRCE